ncbi:hypothetical protein INT45_013604 [Circinella minor]|uniref:Uncharacterized protein n=1 Tax=Circinella minor TaxID=1195481 RepID=A0A8H7RJ87_9FUNG|nr:hypothetical protein INT45_013604 [Circinella minor]
MEYGLAIAKLNRDDYNTLQETQNTCLRKIYGTKTNHSMAIIHHLTNLEFMVDRVTTLQAKFIFRSYNMPDDALFPTLLPHVRQTKGLRSWTSVIRKNKIWQSLDTTTQLDHHTVTNSNLKTAIKQHIKNTHIQHCQRKNSKLLNQCRQQLGIDPILWLPMTSTERNLCVYYRLGWITNHQQQPCSNCHQTTRLSKQHLLSCHRVHRFLSISNNISDPISFILNRLPKTPPTSQQKRVYWKIIWPKLCYILHQLHRTCRPDYYTAPSPPKNQFGHLLLKWIEPPLQTAKAIMKHYRKPNSEEVRKAADSFRLSPKDLLRQAKDNEQYYCQQFDRVDKLCESLRAKVKELETTLTKKRLNHRHF